MERLYLNGEKCNLNTLSKCAPNKGNILITYDTLSRANSPETILSSSDSDVIILDNGVGEKVPPWNNAREVETNQFTRNLKGLRTPSPRAIVTQWLQASPTCKTPENTQTIVVERTIEDKEQYALSSNTALSFEMFDLGANRRNTLTGENLSRARLSPTSPETRRKQELCSYLQLMNMNSKSDKQRTKIRSNFNRRSNRVKNLIVQIEKRKLEQRLRKEIVTNTSDNTNTQNTSSVANDIIPQREWPILQGFTPSLMPMEVRKRRVPFDIVMRRFITDETITINRKKRAFINSDDESSNTAVTKRLRQNNTTTADDARSKITARIAQKKDLKDTSEEVKTFNRNAKRNSGFELTLFEREINKINRMGRQNKISRYHNLRILNNRLKHSENLPIKIKKRNMISGNVLKAKLGKSSGGLEHRNNGVNKLGERNDEKSVICCMEKKLTEIVDLSKTSSVLNKTAKEANLKENTPIIAKNDNLMVINNLTVGQKSDNSYYIIDHTYAQTTNLYHNESIDQQNFDGFTVEEQIASKNILGLISEVHAVNNNETTTKEACTLVAKENVIIEPELVNDSFDNAIVETDNCVASELNQLIHNNMHDYYAHEEQHNKSDNSSTSNDDSSDSSSVYSAISVNTCLKSPEVLREPLIDKSPDESLLKDMLKLLNEATTPQQLEALDSNVTKIDKITEPPDMLNLIPPPEEEKRPFTPTYIPFVNQNKTPCKTLHRNLTRNNNNIRRKTALLDSPSASCPRDNTLATSLPPNSNSFKHCATLAPSDGRLLHAEYCAGQLIASQERLVTCWAQTPLGHILHSQDLWIARGAVARQQFGNDSVLKHMKNRVMIIDNVVSYVEIWVKEHRSAFRERPVADVFAVLYSWKVNQSVEKKLIQLENIKGSADDVQCIILKKSPSVLVSWSIQSQLKQTTVLHLYELSPDYQRVLTIKELKSVGTKIQSLHTIEDSDDLIIGCGENCINIWNIENGYIVATLDMPDILPEPKCLWTLGNQGFVFLLQECNDGLLRLIAINGMKMKITWKNLKIFHPPKEYYNLQGVCLENGILIACYENGILSWNVQTSELLTEEPLPTEEMTPFSSPSCFLSDSHIVQLERNGHIHVRHVSYHLLTSCDLSV